MEFTGTEYRIFVSLIGVVFSLLAGICFSLLGGGEGVMLICALLAIGFTVALILALVVHVGMAAIDLRYIDAVIIDVVPVTWSISALHFWRANGSLVELAEAIIFGIVLIMVIVAAARGWSTLGKIRSTSARRRTTLHYLILFVIWMLFMVASIIVALTI